MLPARHAWLAPLALSLLIAPAHAQQPTPPAPRPQTTPAALIAPTPVAPPTGVAATVNGQNIMEVAVFRALKRVPPDQQEQFRTEVLNFLVDKTLLDQYLAQARVVVEQKDIDAKFAQVCEEIKKHGSTVDKVMKDLVVTEAEMKAEIAGQLRWEKLIETQASDAVLRELLEKNLELFDGTMVKARHILLTPPAGDAAAAEQAKVKLAGFKKQVDDGVAQGLAKLPATADALAREKERTKLMEEAFGAIAAKESACPSRSQGGDLGFFPRAGSMVEPFAQAAFALKPHQVSDIVPTQFGMHLILVTERKAGKALKFEDAKDAVKEYYGEKLRDNLLARLRPTAKITINPPAK